MNLRDYVRDLSTSERLDLAARAGTSWGQLRNMAFSGKTCGPLLAVNIERATRGAVGRRQLRPDDWFAIWPEMAGASDQLAQSEDVRAAA